VVGLGKLRAATVSEHDEVCLEPEAAGSEKVEWIWRQRVAKELDLLLRAHASSLAPPASAYEELLPFDASFRPPLARAGHVGCKGKSFRHQNPLRLKDTGHDVRVVELAAEL
jgi:hypothetical protein